MKHEFLNCNLILDGSNLTRWNEKLKIKNMESGENFYIITYNGGEWYDFKTNSPASEAKEITEALNEIEYVKLGNVEILVRDYDTLVFKFFDVAETESYEAAIKKISEKRRERRSLREAIERKKDIAESTRLEKRGEYILRKLIDVYFENIECVEVQRDTMIYPAINMLKPIDDKRFGFYILTRSYHQSTPAKQRVYNITCYLSRCDGKYGSASITMQCENVRRIAPQQIILSDSKVVGRGKYRTYIRRAKKSGKYILDYSNLPEFWEETRTQSVGSVELCGENVIASGIYKRINQCAHLKKGCSLTIFADNLEDTIALIDTDVSK